MFKNIAFCFSFSYGGGQACVCQCVLPVEARELSGAAGRVGCEQPAVVSPLEEQCAFTVEPPPSGLGVCFLTTPCLRAVSTLTSHRLPSL